MGGFPALFHKELLRFWKVVVQTVVAPVVTALLYLLIFSHVLEDHVQPFPGVAYSGFLVPGLVMMSMLQNACANSAARRIQSRLQGEGGGGVYLKKKKTKKKNKKTHKKKKKKRKKKKKKENTRKKN